MGPHAERRSRKIYERAPFALQFRTPAVMGYVPQRIYALTHSVLGTVEIFLVPLGADADGMRYEAVFA